MKKQIDVSELRDRLDSIIDEIIREQTDYILLCEGRPAIALIPHEEFVRWQRTRQEILKRFDRTLERLAAQNAHFSEEEIAADVEAAIAEVRNQK
jgi:PHD/YefM family antitoxin component YafN of YafNO toxin-antitoxin module